ncbi:MAG: molybdenum cofactor guanylyltransferase [Gemmatimonadetes bacterium]|nr:molybdenum cofactor guanylyltransferase [Gemmatimonadota bacterium]
MIPAEEITGIIVAGGDGQRMGGVTKSLLVAAGAPLIAHVRARLAPQVGTVMISANVDPTAHGAWGDVVMADHVPGMGPLGGLLSILEHVATPYAFCCPGDAPLLDPTLVSRLGLALRRASADIAFPHDGHQLQHLFLLFPTSLRGSLRRYLSEGGRSVHGWTDGLNSVIVDCAQHPDAFLNINTQDNLQRADRLLTPIAVAP